MQKYKFSHYQHFWKMKKISQQKMKKILSEKVEDFKVVVFTNWLQNGIFNLTFSNFKKKIVRLCKKQKKLEMNIENTNNGKNGRK